MILTEADKARFWSNIDQREEGECWPWLRSCREGYGRFGLNGKKESAHCVAWTLDRNRQIPELFEGYPSMICHSCDRPSCCNPIHLFLGNQFYNMADSAVKGRSAGFKFKGGNNPIALLTEPKVCKIKIKLKENVLTQKQIAEMFGVSRQTICEINAGRRWSHIQI